MAIFAHYILFAAKNLFSRIEESQSIGTVLFKPLSMHGIVKEEAMLKFKVVFLTQKQCVMAPAASKRMAINDE